MGRVHIIPRGQSIGIIGRPRDVLRRSDGYLWDLVIGRHSGNDCMIVCAERGSGVVFVVEPAGTRRGFQWLEFG